MANPEENGVQKECWTEETLKEAMKKLDAGEITINNVENLYGIPPRVIYRQRAKENIRAQLNPERPSKSEIYVNEETETIDYTILTQPVGINSSDLNGAFKMLASGTQEVKDILTNECSIIYECKVCKALFRSIVNFISHKRRHCELYRNSCREDSDNESQWRKMDDASMEDKLKMKQYIRDQVNRPNRRTCRTDLTSIVQRIMDLPLTGTEPILKLQTVDTNSSAFYQTLISNIPVNGEVVNSVMEAATEKAADVKTNVIKPKKTNKLGDYVGSLKHEQSASTQNDSSNATTFTRVLFRCPCCDTCLAVKKNVVRHLKTVHRKSVDQIIRLKSKIQMQIVKVKKHTNENNTVKSVTNIDPRRVKTAGAIVNTIFRPVCQLCGKSFGYQRSLRVHLRQHCPKRKQLFDDLKSDDGSNTRNDAATSIIPIIKLPLISVNSPSVQQSKKKIGIQVRMNYSKDCKNGNNGYEQVADIRDEIKKLQENPGLTTSCKFSPVKNESDHAECDKDIASSGKTNDEIESVSDVKDKKFDISTNVNDVTENKDVCTDLQTNKNSPIWNINIKTEPKSEDNNETSISNRAEASTNGSSSAHLDFKVVSCETRTAKDNLKQSTSKKIKLTNKRETSNAVKKKISPVRNKILKKEQKLKAEIVKKQAKKEKLKIKIVKKLQNEILSSEVKPSLVANKEKLKPFLKNKKQIKSDKQQITINKVKKPENKKQLKIDDKIKLKNDVKLLQSKEKSKLNLAERKKLKTIGALQNPISSGKSDSVRKYGNAKKSKAGKNVLNGVVGCCSVGLGDTKSHQNVIPYSRLVDIENIIIPEKFNSDDVVEHSKRDIILNRQDTLI